MPATIDDKIGVIRSHFAAIIGATISGYEAAELQLDGRNLDEIVDPLDKGWLEIFNALDENGYDFHAEKPSGKFIPCI